eukprot:TRINITY_DN57364_c0_g1_i1.p1 TRINITY_DN57364_c0_g1~~TRINITY_DN57364_c0_g1_i1.p1  ORF type:complete len:197 (+),score=78.65 TRINITY_DN57364_c0_g1_i1:86-592(+)
MSSEQQWEDVWNLFDQKKAGNIPKADFLSCVRALGRKYTRKDMDEKTKDIPDPCPKDKFMAFMREPYTGPTVEDLRKALMAFDGKDCGSLPISQINLMLKGMGDKLSDEEAQIILDGLPQDGGQVNIDKMVEFLNPPIPSTQPNIEELTREIEAEEAAKDAAAAEGAG